MVKKLKNGATDNDEDDDDAGNIDADENKSGADKPGVVVVSAPTMKRKRKRTPPLLTMRSKEIPCMTETGEIVYVSRGNQVKKRRKRRLSASSSSSSSFPGSPPPPLLQLQQQPPSSSDDLSEDGASSMDDVAGFPYHQPRFASVLLQDQQQRQQLHSDEGISLTFEDPIGCAAAKIPGKRRPVIGQNVADFFGPAITQMALPWEEMASNENDQLDTDQSQIMVNRVEAKEADLHHEETVPLEKAMNPLNKRHLDKHTSKRQAKIRKKMRSEKAAREELSLPVANLNSYSEGNMRVVNGPTISNDFLSDNNEHVMNVSYGDGNNEATTNKRDSLVTKISNAHLIAASKAGVDVVDETKSLSSSRVQDVNPTTQTATTSTIRSKGMVDELFHGMRKFQISEYTSSPKRLALQSTSSSIASVAEKSGSVNERIRDSESDCSSARPCLSPPILKLNDDATAAVTVESRGSASLPGSPSLSPIGGQDIDDNVLNNIFSDTGSPNANVPSLSNGIFSSDSGCPGYNSQSSGKDRFSDATRPDVNRRSSGEDFLADATSPVLNERSSGDGMFSDADESPTSNMQSSLLKSSLGIVIRKVKKSCKKSAAKTEEHQHQKRSFRSIDEDSRSSSSSSSSSCFIGNVDAVHESVENKGIGFDETMEESGERSGGASRHEKSAEEYTLTERNNFKIMADHFLTKRQIFNEELRLAKLNNNNNSYNNHNNNYEGIADKSKLTKKEKRKRKEEKSKGFVGNKHVSNATGISSFDNRSRSEEQIMDNHAVALDSKNRKRKRDAPIPN